MARRLVWLFILVAVARIVSTYWTLNHTIDEPFFIGCGLEWLEDRRYTYMPEQPPLSHITAAIGAKLAGARNVSPADFASKAPLILYDSPSYWRTLASARAGELPFFVLAALAVWLWARRLHGERVALAAVLLFTTLPVVLGHAGLATTDIAICAMLPAALYAFVVWVDEPGVRQALWLAAAVAGGVLSKFSFLLYFPVCVMVLLLLRGRWKFSRRHLVTLVPAVLASVAVICAVYRFDLGPLWQGLKDVKDHNDYGHLSYLFGERRITGWWYFFPVVFAYKTPLAFLALIALSCFWLKRESWGPLGCGIAVLIAAMPSHINIGVRHILPIFPLLAIPAGFAAVRLMESASWMQRGLAGCLILWQLAASARAHPDYFAYFNELAHGKPELIRVDSDLDWGQAYEELASRLRSRGIKETVSICGFGCVIPARHGLVDAVLVEPWNPATGWVAISATERYLSDRRPPDGVSTKPWAWLDRYEPTERIAGGAMLLYYIPRN